MISKAGKLLKDLIALPSVNPAFLPAGHPFAGEGAVADFLADKAAKAGLDVELQRARGGRANVLISFSPPGRVRQRILLAPHMDTVGGEDLPRLVAPRVEGNRMYGRGACDTKGSVACMFAALIALANSRIHATGTEVTLAALVDEESEQAGSRTLAKSGYRADLAIVGEPTRLKLVTAHKGVLWLELRTRGKAAHGARPELGVNAVHEMARAVDLVETLYASRLRKRNHRLLGRATVNIGAMHGGNQPNIVPASCTALLDRRMLPGESDGEVIREIQSLLRSRGLKVAICPLHPAECPALETDTRNACVRRFMKVLGQRSPAGVDYFSDAGVLASAGIPSVLFGPGDIAQAHTPNEWIDLRQVEQASDLLARFLQS